MSVDRFRELKNFQSSKKEIEPLNIEEVRLQVDNKQEIEMEGFQILGQFQKQADRLKLVLEKVEGNSQRTKQLKNRYSKATTALIEKDVSYELDGIIAENSKLNERLDKIIREMQTDLQQDLQDYPDEPETRMKKQMLACQVQKTREVMQQSQSEQQEFKESLKEKVRRQVKHLDEKLTEQQVEEMCDNPEQVQVLLQEKMYGKASIQLQNAVTDIKDKYKDIQKLERSVERVFKLFQDLAALTFQQGEHVDRIEGLVGQAHDYVNKAEKHQISAKKDQQASQKKMCCIFVIIMFILIIILAPILAKAL